MTPSAAVSSPWNLESVLALGRKQQLELFATLPSPDLSEIQGEYLGHPERLDDPDGGAVQRAALFDESSPFGFWLGKGFKQTGADAGEGYNHCRKAEGRVVRHLRFATRMGASYIDGKPTFLLSYAAFKNRSGAQDLTDEVRRLASGLYLCTATVRLPNGGRSRPTIFLLSGPVAGWVGPDDPVKEQL